MIDYLSPEYIAETNAISDRVLSKQDIIDAVFRLWLEPNDTLARGVLVEYIRYRAPLDEKSNIKPIREIKGRLSGLPSGLELEPALKSRIMTRIAHSIHGYDRYKENLLTFLLRNVISAENDLLDALKRIKASAVRRYKTNVKIPAHNAAPADSKSLASASKKLDIPPERLRSLLEEIRSSREEGDMSIREMADKLGVSPYMLESFIYKLKPDDKAAFIFEDSKQQEELLWEEYAEDDGIPDESTEWKTGGRKKLQDLGAQNEGAAINLISSADVLFQRYLIMLNEKKPTGEWVSGSPRREEENPDVPNTKLIKPIGMQVLQMSEAELHKTRIMLDDYQKAIARYRDMIKNYGKEEGGKQTAPSELPLPPKEVFEAWYDTNRKGLRDRKQKSMHMFLYEEYFLAEIKPGWEDLDEKYRNVYNAKVPVSAKRVLYKKKDIMDSFKESLKTRMDQ